MASPGGQPHEDHPPPPSQVHKMEEAGFSSFSEGTGSDFPRFASWIKAETE